MSSQITEDFLERWPTLQELQKARIGTLQRFFIAHNSRNSDNIDSRVEEILRAVPATHDSAVIIASSSAPLALMRVLRDAISAYDLQIEKLAHAHPDFAIPDSFPERRGSVSPSLNCCSWHPSGSVPNGDEIQCLAALPRS